MEHSITRAEQSTLQAGRLLATSIALPRVPASDAAQARVSDWLADIAEQPAAAALARLLADQAAVRGLIVGFAEGAPYLWDLARAEPARLLTLLQSDPDARFDEILAGPAPPAPPTPARARTMTLPPPPNPRAPPLRPLP